MEDLQKEIEQLRAEVKALEETNKELDSENDDLRQEVKDLESDLDEKRDEVRELELRNEDYINPNYEYEGIGSIYIKCDNLSDQHKLESVLDVIFKRVSP